MSGGTITALACCFICTQLAGASIQAGTPWLTLALCAVGNALLAGLIASAR